MRRGVWSLLLLFALLLSDVTVQAADGPCPAKLDAASCQLLQAALANWEKVRAFNVSYELSIAKSVSSTTTGLVGGGVGFFDLAISGKDQRQAYLAARFARVDDNREARVELHLIDGQWYLQTDGQANSLRLKPAPTRPDQYRTFLVMALTTGVRDVQVDRLDHVIDQMDITAIRVTYDAPVLLRVLFTGAGRNLVKAALGSQLLGNADAELDKMAVALGAADSLRITYLVGPDQYFHGLIVQTERPAGPNSRISLRFALEISQIGSPVKFDDSRGAR